MATLTLDLLSPGRLTINVEGRISQGDTERFQALVNAGCEGYRVEAIQSIGDWLYFDRKGAPAEFSQTVRRLYDRLIPTNLIDEALLYTRFWPADIRDPDREYSGGDSDFDYSTRKAREIAVEIAASPEMIEQAVRAMAARELHNVFPFAHELAARTSNPEPIFSLALEVFSTAEQRNHTQFVRGVLSAIDARDKTIADRCVQRALESGAFEGQAVNLYTAVSITPQRLAEIVDSLRAGELTPAECAFLSYGKGLDALMPSQFAPLLNELEARHGAQGKWTAMEIVSMYLHGRSVIDPLLVDFVKRVTSSADLLDHTRKANRDGYLFENLVERVNKQKQVDDEYARALSGQVIRLCQSPDYSVFAALDDAMRKLIKGLTAEHATAVWEPIARFFEVATPTERHQLDRLVGAPRGNTSAAGPLFDVPEAAVFDWVASDPEHRIAFPCSFFPLFIDSSSEKRWHPSLERLATKFGCFPAFTGSISNRLHPGSWTGSLVPYLRAYLAPLEQWFHHSVPQVARWARNTHRRIENQIEKERELDMDNR